MALEKMCLPFGKSLDLTEISALVMKWYQVCYSCYKRWRLQIQLLKNYKKRSGFICEMQRPKLSILEVNDNATENENDDRRWKTKIGENNLKGDVSNYCSERFTHYEG